MNPRHLIAIFLISSSTLCIAEPYFGSAVGSTHYGEFSRDATSLEMTLGYRFSDNFAVESSWLNLGEGAIQVRSGVFDEISISGLLLGMAFNMPLTQDITWFTRGGVYLWEQESEYLTTQALIRSKGEESDSDIFFGAGIYVKINDTMRLRLTYLEVDIVGENISNLSAGFVVAF